MHLARIIILFEVKRLILSFALFGLESVQFIDVTAKICFLAYCDFR